MNRLTNPFLLREFGTLLVEHLALVGISLAIACLIAIPAGILLTRRQSLQRGVLGIVNVAQTIPSLALFGLLLPIPILGGIGKRTAIIALILYALLPILRNTIVGISSIPPSVRDAAIALGMTDRQLLMSVELPLSSRTLIAGIRIAAVTTIGTATIAAAVGGGGLGVFIFRGISLVDSTQILLGAVPAALLAVITDELLSWVETRLALSS